MQKSSSPYDVGLEKKAANFVPLSPLSFLRRTAQVYPLAHSIIYGDRTFSWSETAIRCRRFASFLARNGVRAGDTVAAMLPNVPAMVELHFSVPLAGAVLNALNVRLDAATIAFMLQHSEAKVVLVDPEFADTLARAIEHIPEPKPLVIDVLDPAYGDSVRVGDVEYEDAVEQGDAAFEWTGPADEWDAIALSYTSGTTGDPKGVVTHHRGAYLNAINNILASGMSQCPVYLWTLPMFHCNGWCFPWTIAAMAGTNICLRKVEPQRIFELIERHGVTHMAGAPIVYATLTAAADPCRPISRSVSAFIAGAAPPVSVIETCERINISLIHVYGLTEVYGPAAFCAPMAAWQMLPLEERARKKRRQGVAYPLQEDVAVIDPATMLPVPHDGETLGEVMFRGNIVMKGYLKNRAATEASFAGGWFHTGDLGVTDREGYITITDRSKDIIISGGENVSSVEVEDVLYKHPSVMFAAVVAKPDKKWGEVPCAFIELKDGFGTSEADVISFCRKILPGFKTPKAVIFGPLPKTSTGKIQKFLLREQANSALAISSD
ncbi:acyl-CoA synthetase [Bradyrhizobium japonicum]|uniref:acyl-CoA synthetase n=1 Tax=Bradyrhizobium japonicum TaxID=375 RepID=UPI0004BAA00B|nr:acyl-CoA synthetase [Bradyrhizobium japonicum]